MRKETKKQTYNFIEDYLSSPSSAIPKLKAAADKREWPEGPSDEELYSFEYMRFVQYVIDDALDSYYGNKAA